MTSTGADRLIQDAVDGSGPWPGPIPFVANLERLAGAAERTGRLTPTGRQVLGKVAVRHLRNLHDVLAHVGAHPEVARQTLDAPVVITGLPRTGTTLLHNLVALDPAHRVLRVWEGLHPVPPTEGGPSAEDQQARAERWLARFRGLVPAFQAIHPATATGPEECDVLLQNTFASQHFDDMFDAEDYSRWLATAALADEYAHYALQLRVLSAPGTTWALKSPGHLGHLDALRVALPDATVVVCHRRPREAVSSYASLIHTLRGAYSDAASPAAAGRQALARAATAMARALAVRDGATGPAFVDVSYPQLAADSVGTTGALYEQLGRALDPTVERAMRAWAAANPQHGHGPHRHDLAAFGLGPAEVDAAFAGYLDRFAGVAGA